MPTVPRAADATDPTPAKAARPPGDELRALARKSEILDVVTDLLETEGYEAVQVRTVAKRARISLTTMYQLFGSLDEMIITALDRWMDEFAYDAISMPEPDETPYEILVRIMRSVFRPWEEHPRMLVAYYKARLSSGGDHLLMRGLSVARPVAAAALSNADPRYTADMQVIFKHVIRGAVSRFACGEIEVTDILPILERTLARLMSNNEIEFLPQSWRAPEKRHTKSRRKPVRVEDP
jgi:TetR/AcrR family transcriptional regulator, cholesterol catabolism regulator